MEAPVGPEDGPPPHPARHRESDSVAEAAGNEFEIMIACDAGERQAVSRTVV
jgi:hypothetical protein